MNERTETWNQVGLFLLKSRSFKLILSQTTHHSSRQSRVPVYQTCRLRWLEMHIVGDAVI